MAVRKVLKHSAWIAYKDLLEFSRSRMRLVMLILMPLFMMVMIGYMFPSGNTLKHTPVAIANLDEGYNNTSYGETFMAQLEMVNDKTDMMDLHKVDDYEAIKTRIQDGEVNGGIIIPANFSKALATGERGEITIITDQSNPQLSMTLQGILTATIDQMGTQKAMGTLNITYNVSMNSTMATIKPYKVQTRGIVPGNPNYFEFIAPGMMAMVVMMSLMTGLPHAISYEKDIGTMDGLLVAPISRLSIILGKVMAQTTLGMVQGLLILVLAMALFGVVVYGSILLVILLLLLIVFSFVGLGILITSFTDNEQTASMIMMTLMFPMMFMSGVFFPLQQMPWFMQYIARCLPLTYATSAMRKVVVLGADMPSIMTEVTILLVFGVVMLAIAVPMFKKAMSR